MQNDISAAATDVFFRCLYRNPWFPILHPEDIQWCMVRTPVDMFPDDTRTMRRNRRFACTFPRRRRTILLRGSSELHSWPSRCASNILLEKCLGKKQVLVGHKWVWNSHLERNHKGSSLLLNMMWRELVKRRERRELSFWPPFTYWSGDGLFVFFDM